MPHHARLQALASIRWKYYTGCHAVRNLPTGLAELCCGGIVNSMASFPSSPATRSGVQPPLSSIRHRDA